MFFGLGDNLDSQMYFLINAMQDLAVSLLIADLYYILCNRIFGSCRIWIKFRSDLYSLIWAGADPYMSFRIRGRNQPF
jgi:hypothetical protein